MKNRRFTFFAVILRIIALLGLGAAAQTAPLTPGAVSSVGSITCPTDFWSNPTTPAVCFQATLTCANTSTTPSLNFVFSYDKPSSSPKGVVVLFADASGVIGRVPVNKDFAEDYFNANYEVVEIGWTPTDWEQTSDPLGIMTAACRPAGFLAYALTNSLLNPRLSNPSAGFCAQGVSAGSGALGYSLAWYGDGSGGGAGNPLSGDIDDVELVSGPVFSNIKLGCQVPNPPTPGSICVLGQFGCSSGTTTWTDSFSYTPNDLGPVGAWTNDSTCNNVTSTSSSSNAKWLAMSIVNGSRGSFSYPNTGLGGWLCASSSSHCTAPECPNNSASQGNTFYSQFTGSSQTVAFRLTGITGCYGPENIEAGVDPDNGSSGEAAVVARMSAQCKHPSP
jgi:hypothetical protein